MRPYIVKNLFSIRNDIDHHDVPPPSRERALELLDITWYFLKATDGILEARKESFYFAPHFDAQYFVHFDIDYDDYEQVNFWGWFPVHKVFYQSAIGTTPIKVLSLKTKINFENEFHINRLDTDLCIHGYFQSEEVSYPIILRRCLSGY